MEGYKNYKDVYKDSPGNKPKAKDVKRSSYKKDEDEFEDFYFDKTEEPNVKSFKIKEKESNMNT